VTASAVPATLVRRRPPAAVRRKRLLLAIAQHSVLIAFAIAFLAPLNDGEEPHWHVTFAVTDRDEAVLRAEELGAVVVSGPTDDQWTRSAVVRDPQGAVFTLSQFDPQ